jgi:hypothetical protein
MFIINEDHIVKIKFINHGKINEKAKNIKDLCEGD